MPAFTLGFWVCGTASGWTPMMSDPLFMKVSSPYKRLVPSPGLVADTLWRDSRLIALFSGISKRRVRETYIAVDNWWVSRSVLMASGLSGASVRILKDFTLRVEELSGVYSDTDDLAFQCQRELIQRMVWPHTVHRSWQPKSIARGLRRAYCPLLQSIWDKRDNKCKTHPSSSVKTNADLSGWAISLMLAMSAASRVRAWKLTLQIYPQHDRRSD